jgi:NAD(P)-dependent dehydrogenase (short-subunit alcohol dehydrogenase family)
VSPEGSGRLAVVTGVGGGVGAAAARRLSEAGWVVAGVGRGATGPAGVEHYAPIDLAGPEAQQRLASFFAELPRIDALVNNAAVQIVKTLIDTTVEEWDRMMAVNLRAAFLTMQLAHAQLRSARGTVVNVASVHAVATSVGLAGYAASKGGLVALTRAAALEFAPDGIRVNALVLGAVDTPMLRAGAARYGDEGIRRIGARTPMGRVGEADEAARAIIYLAGPESAFITGATLTADGGVLAALSSE